MVDLSVITSSAQRREQLPILRLNGYKSYTLKASALGKRQGINSCTLSGTMIPIAGKSSSFNTQIYGTGTVDDDLRRWTDFIIIFIFEISDGRSTVKTSRYSMIILIL